NPGKTPESPWTAGVPSLVGVLDPHYAGFDLDYSDVQRVKEWKREFDSFVNSGTLPQFEFVWLPNDHTSASKPGKPTPSAYVAQNDYALGQLIDAVSHSKVWKSTVVFAM